MDTKETLDKVQQDAAAGDVHAAYQLGMRYAEGEGGVEESLEKAAGWLGKAAENGHYHALHKLFRLAEEYCNGREEDSYGIIKGILATAERGYPEGQSQFGWFRLQGKGTSGSTRDAMRWFLLSNGHGATRSFELAREVLWPKGEYIPGGQSIVEYFRVRALAGDAEMQFCLGACYKHGMVFASPDATEAVNWLIKSAQQGFSAAQYLLGNMYYLGDQVERNIPEAEKWVRKSAEQGNAGAEYLLGEFLLKGVVGASDPVAAVEWYKKAVKHGNVDACLALGMLYEEEKDIPKNLVEAAKCYKKAILVVPALAVHPVAAFRLGNLFYSGEEVGKDDEAAFEYWNLAAIHGMLEARRNLAIMHMSGALEVKGGTERAMQLLKEAADAGDDVAKEYLAKL